MHNMHCKALQVNDKCIHNNTAQIVYGKKFL